MHSYSIDKNVRKKANISIFILSMVLSILGRNYFTAITNAITDLITKNGFQNLIYLVSWLDIVPNLMGVIFWYGIITLIYEKCLWRYLETLHGIHDFSGIWEGTLESSYNKKSIPMKITIKQTWQDISIKSEFLNTKSISDSNVAAIHMNEIDGIKLYFGYSNSSHDLKNKMQEHNGYNILRLVDDSTIIGRYFNDRENPDPKISGGNKGQFNLKRIKEKKS